MYNHNKAQQSKNRVHISWDILYMHVDVVNTLGLRRSLLSNLWGWVQIWFKFFPSSYLYWQQVSIDVDNGVAPKRLQPLIQTYGDKFTGDSLDELIDTYMGNGNGFLSDLVQVIIPT